MIGELLRIAQLGDGVRCDMAMRVVPEVFERTWEIRAAPFWPRATARVREKHPEFTFMAEVYWDMEWALPRQGFDYTCDKRLYDRLRDRHARPVREHFRAGLDYQNKRARFLENAVALRSGGDHLQCQAHGLHCPHTGVARRVAGGRHGRGPFTTGTNRVTARRAGRGGRCALGNGREALPGPFDGGCRFTDMKGRPPWAANHSIPHSSSARFFPTFGCRPPCCS